MSAAFEVTLLKEITLRDWKLSKSTQNVIMRRFGRSRSLLQLVILLRVTLTREHMHIWEGEKANSEICCKKTKWQT